MNTHVHTEAECGHVVPNLTIGGVKSCWSCGENNPQTHWCHERCAVFHAEMIELVKLAERTENTPD